MPLGKRLAGLLTADNGRFSQQDNLDGVTNDGEAILSWLQAHREVPNTLRAYLRHLESLLLWLQDRGLALSDLTRPHARDFMDWSLNHSHEAPRAIKVTKTGKVATPKPATPMSLATYNQRLGAMNSLFSHIVDGGYLSGNPFAGIKVKNTRKSLDHRRRSLNTSMLDAVMAEIGDMPELEQARTKLLVIGITKLAARRSEAADAKLSDLYLKDDGTWWWTVRGKGGKVADVPVSDLVIAAIRHYRRTARLPEAWRHTDPDPIFPGTLGRQVGDQMHYLHLTRLFRHAAMRLALDDPNRSRLEKASPHWLRHTGLTQLADQLDLRAVKEVARHSDINTTAHYTNVDSAALHKEVNRVGF